MQRVGRLINLCNNQHDCLHGQRSILPKRVVDIGDDSTHTLRLYCPEEDEKARYTILSHCWGGTSPFLTLQSNIDALKQGFDIAELPTTFRDAVAFTRALGIRYLWIDSICIIQQDEKDWDSEGPNMAAYYTNAYLTIAASRAANSSAGFLHMSDRRRMSTIHCESNGVQFDCIMSDPNNTADPPLSTPNCEAGNPLYTRAWVFQEMVLSPRVISFGAKELEWYCRKQNWCECTYLMPNDIWAARAHSPHWKYSREGVLNPDCLKWMQIVVEYTRRKLTFTSDRLPALSGLATRFSEALQAPYLAGIWKTDPFIWETLQWTAGGSAGNLLPKPRAPSWSWASIDGRISYDGFIPGCDGVTLLGAETQLLRSNPFGEVTGGFLRVEGVLLKVRLNITPKTPLSTWKTRPSHNWEVLSIGGRVHEELEAAIKETETVGQGIRFAPDTPLELAPSTEASRMSTEENYRRSSRSNQSAIKPMSGVAYCLRFLKRPVPAISSTTTSVSLLVLACLDEETRIYERLGLAWLDMIVENEQFFREMKPQILTIV
ncbi:HET-domain-containing protein [Ophiobolus disseminans]|uniref:HET-domain-containing protein n=1 Tax=Ophiobolus disseminans TaxID=1469910 RepID=A0A6A7A4E2_9PLEO|nr:HET-domain-containing protein [Ophiobolus disseminans]